MPCVHTPYISHGYRVDYDYIQCLKSLFAVHNETMNIWSHLIGFVCVVVAGIAILVEYQTVEVPFFDRLALAVYIVGAAVCLLFSTIYHLFGCMSTEHQEYLFTLDLSGVACLTGGSLFIWNLYGLFIISSTE